MDAGIFLLRKRFDEHQEWFRSDRIAFIDSIFTQLWIAKSERFARTASEDGSGRIVPENAMDLVTGEHPKFKQSWRVWGVDVDEIYTVLNLGDYHWVALLIDVHQRHINIWDSIVSVGAGKMAGYLNPLCEMLGYVMNMLAADKKMFPNVPYTWSVAPENAVPQAPSGDCGLFALKYIEYHSLGIPFSEAELCESNVKKMREKLATEVYDELKTTGTEALNYEGLDAYEERW